MDWMLLEANELCYFVHVSFECDAISDIALVVVRFAAW